MTSRQRLKYQYYKTDLQFDVFSSIAFIFLVIDKIGSLSNIGVGLIGYIPFYKVRLYKKSMMRLEPRMTEPGGRQTIALFAVF